MKLRRLTDVEIGVLIGTGIMVCIGLLFVVAGIMNSWRGEDIEAEVPPQNFSSETVVVDGERRYIDLGVYGVFADDTAGEASTLVLKGCCSKTEGLEYRIEVLSKEPIEESIVAGRYYMTWLSPDGTELSAANYEPGQQVTLDDNNPDEHLARKGIDDKASEADWLMWRGTNLVVDFR